MHSDQKKKKEREIFCRNSQIFCLDLSSRLPPLIFPLMFLAKAHPFPKLNPSIRGASPIIMPFDFEPAFRSRSSSSSSSRIPRAPLGSKAFSSASFHAATTFHFFRRLFLAPFPLFFRPPRSTHPARPNGNATHPSISIGEFQFISWFLTHASISNEMFAISRRGFEI